MAGTTRALHSLMVGNLVGDGLHAAVASGGASG